MDTFVVFPGQGSQHSGMGKSWYDNFVKFREAFEEASDASSLHIKKLAFDSSDSDIRATDIAQPLILTVSVGIWRVLENDFGVHENFKSLLFAGHSLGEYSALVAGGAMKLGEAAKLVNLRGKFMQEAVPVGQGGMRALILKEAANEEKLQALCRVAAEKSGKPVSVANWNSDTQVVLSGLNAALEAVDQLVKEEPYKWVRKSIALEVSAPFHSPLMEKAAEKLKAALEQVTFAPSKTNYIRNVDAEISTMDDPTKIRAALVRQLSANVRWYPTLLCANEAGCERQIEVGSGKVLTGIASRIAVLSQWKFGLCSSESGIQFGA